MDDAEMAAMVAGQGLQDHGGFAEEADAEDEGTIGPVHDDGRAALTFR